MLASCQECFFICSISNTSNLKTNIHKSLSNLGFHLLIFYLHLLSAFHLLHFLKSVGPSFKIITPGIKKLIGHKWYLNCGPPERQHHAASTYFAVYSLELEAVRITFLTNSWGRLPQMVERALQKFLPQWEVVRTPPAPVFFCVELKYIPLIRNFESLKQNFEAEFGHVSTSEK